MKEYLLGIDLGTSGTKTVLFRSDGTAMATHTVEYPLYQPQNGWAEQEPSDWWRAVRETVQAVLHKSGVAAADVAGVGISGQMHGSICRRSTRPAVISCCPRITFATASPASLPPRYPTPLA